MATYERPVWPRQVFRDADGTVIDYGHRYRDTLEAPPRDAYSRVTHPERCAPLHIVADALISYVVERYDVAADEEMVAITSPPRQIRVVRLTPTARGSASLRFEFTDFPGIVVYPGDERDLMLPACGCDACDDDLDELVQELEEAVLSVVEGRYYPKELDPEIGAALTEFFAHRVNAPARTIELSDVPDAKEAERLNRLLQETSQRRSQAPREGWQPWPERPQ